MLRRFVISLGLFLVAALFVTSATPAGASDDGVKALGGGDVGTAAATPRATYEWAIRNRYCDFDETAANFFQLERGFSGTNYFRQVGQHQVLRNGYWQNRGAPRAQRSVQFANNGQNRTFNLRWYVQWFNEFQFWHRIRVTLQWWNNAGTPNYFGDDYTVAGITVASARC